MSKLLSGGAIIAGFVFLFSSVAIAGTITVATDGSGDYLTIQAAINAAATGDLIQVADGQYTGEGNRDIDFHGKAITVSGNTEDPNMVVIDCQGTKEEPHRGFIFQTGETSASILQGVTIINGYGHLCYSWYYSARAGGGIFLSGASPTIEKCVISNCRARYGGAIFGEDSLPIIRECVITENSACESYPSNGGGIYGCSGLIENCIISNNSSDVDGAAFSYYKGTISKCTITGNKAIQEGGALHSCSGTISNSIISGNSTRHAGGAFARYNGKIMNCTVHLNSASIGGAIYNEGWPDNSGDSCLTITGCVFEGNTSDDCGGAIYSIGCGNQIITDSTFKNNSSDNGGAFYSYGSIEPSEILLKGCQFTDNPGSDSHPSAVRIAYCEKVRVEDCIFDRNKVAIDAESVDALLVSESEFTGQKKYCMNFYNPVNDNYFETVNCIFTDNYKIGSAGNKVIGSTFTGNTGYGISADEFINCTFIGNSHFDSHYGDGGAVNGAKLIEGCVFIGNSCRRNGGGAADVITVKNSIFAGNKAKDGGGLAYATNIINCTIIDNRAAVRAGGVRSGGGYGFFSTSLYSTIEDSIIRNNYPDQISYYLGNTNYPAIVTYSNVEGGWPGVGNIDVDPLFAAAGHWDDNGTEGDLS
ncbi:MAG: right-handed parallel beta-helix repeat-containing protein, partial [Anaerohalosphaera sp.]|nr:right-handed parallel beta-helix repeat-containing protein [Anaerohalosphaera sp.]